MDYMYLIDGKNSYKSQNLFFSDNTNQQYSVPYYVQGSNTSMKLDNLCDLCGSRFITTFVDNKSRMYIKVESPQKDPYDMHFLKKACFSCKFEWYSILLPYCKQCDQLMKYDKTLTISHCACKRTTLVKCIVNANDIHNIIIKDQTFITSMRYDENKRERHALINPGIDDGGGGGPKVDNIVHAHNLDEQKKCFCSIM